MAWGELLRQRQQCLQQGGVAGEGGSSPCRVCDLVLRELQGLREAVFSLEERRDES